MSSIIVAVSLGLLWWSGSGLLLLCAGPAMKAIAHLEMVPVPLRSDPTPPILIAQTARPTQPAPTLAGAPLWTYGLTYSCEHAGRGDVIVTASFNVPGLVAEATATVVPDAQSAPTPARPLQQQRYDFSIRLTDRAGHEGTGYLDTLVLTAAQAAPGPSNRWPDVSCRAPDGTLVPLAAGSPSGSTVVYQFPADRIAASARPMITLEWPGLHLSIAQNARGSLSARRPQASGGDALATPSVEAASAVAPLNIWPETFDITGAWTTPADALQSAFQTLFGTLDGELITLGVAYGHRIPSGADDDGLVTIVPVALYPYQVLGPGTAKAIGAAMTEWQTDNPFPDAKGEWIFSLTFYSGMAGMSVRPLMALDRLAYRINRRPSPAQP